MVAREPDSDAGSYEEGARSREQGGMTGER